MAKTISVCIPVYNGELYLEQMLESILAQTYQEIEIIVSDNSSTDRTSDIIDLFAKRDNRIVSIRNDENIGFSKNILKAVSRASSDIVAIYHADDIYDKNIIEREVSLLKSDPLIGGVFALPAVFRNTTHRTIRRPIYTTLAEQLPYFTDLGAMVGGYNEYLPLLLEHGNIFACASFMTRKSVFLKLGGFTDRYPSNEDLELWINYLNSGFKLGIVNDFLLYYRKSDVQVSSYWRSQPELAVMYSVIDEMIINKKELSPDEKVLYAKNMAVGYARAAVNSSLIGNHKKAKMLSLLSRKEYKLPCFGVWGLSQRIPWFGAILVRLANRL